jgi:hypothetical protein
MNSKCLADSVKKIGPKNLNRQISLYSLAAAAAGVSALALVQPAQGSVVVTKTNIQINFGNQASIDLNKDGVNDFTLADIGANYDHFFYHTFAAIPLEGGKVMGGNRGVFGPYASALVKGAGIGPSAHFSSSPALGQLTVERLAGTASASTFTTYYGKWKPGTGVHYLGVKFLIKGATHYGWIRLEMTAGMDGTVTEYAYETVTNKKITAGQTTDSSDETVASNPDDTPRQSAASLGMLALGVDGLAMWRHER